MINYKDPPYLTIPSPVGIDAIIQDIALKLSDLTWLEKPFGRAIAQREVMLRDDVEPLSPVRREVIYPEVYQPNMEPLNVMPNDHLKSYCFFLVNDPTEFLDYNQLDNQMMQRNSISIIFWFNLFKIESGKKWRFTEELKQDVIEILRKHPSLIITDVYEKFENVFAGFTLTDTYRQYQKYPYGGFRFDCSVTFPIITENCEIT